MSIKDWQLSDKWLKAAVIGGLWASIEIVIGSFLHNLRIPFAGTILAAQGIIILLAFMTLWPEKGIIIRAGIITALMKSISPSAVILGPMIGIMTEAILLELFLFIFGRNLFGFIIAASISLSSALLHKIATFIILYGLDIVKIYENIYHWFQKKLHIDNLNATEFILLFLGIYLFWGLISGISGYVIGKKAKKLGSQPIFGLESEKTEDFFPINKNQSFHFYYLLLHMLSIPLGLLLLNFTNVFLGLAFITIFIAFAINKYKQSMRRLKKPIFWVQLVIIVLLAALFGNTESNSSEYFSLDGLLYGLEMSLRAVFIVIAFTAISVELRNPAIQQKMNSNFAKSLYESLSIAFGVLPRVIKALPKSTEFFTHPFRTFSILIAQTKNDFEQGIYKNQENVIDSEKKK